jgi:hypothetical protein
MGNEIEALVRNEHSQNDSENVKKTRPVRVTPLFYVGDNTHFTARLIYTKFTEFSGDYKGGRGRIVEVLPA